MKSRYTLQESYLSNAPQFDICDNGNITGAVSFSDRVYIGDNCEISDAVILAGDCMLLGGRFDGGHFYGGVFHGGSYTGGGYFGGVFYGGEFQGGVFYGGNYYAGLFQGGKFYAGEFRGGKFRGGLYYGGDYTSGLFHNGSFYTGDFTQYMTYYIGVECYGDSYIASTLSPRARLKYQLSA